MSAFSSPAIILLVVDHKGNKFPNVLFGRRGAAGLRYVLSGRAVNYVRPHVKVYFKKSQRARKSFRRKSKQFLTALKRFGGTYGSGCVSP